MSESKDIVKKESQDVENIRKAAFVAAPPVDIYENEGEVLLVADMAGVAKDNLTANFEKNTLTLEGKRELDAPGTAAKTAFESVEYRRVFSVPKGIDADKISAELKHGVLRLHLPKSAALKPRQIEVKAG